MASPHFISTLLGDATQWDSHALAHAPPMDLIGHADTGTQTSQTDAPRILLNLPHLGAIQNTFFFLQKFNAHIQN